MQTALVAIAIGLFFLVAYGDIRNRRIPNAVCLALAALGLVRIALAGDVVAAMCTLAAATVIFVAALPLFWRGAVGGGDVKLVAAMALLIGYREVLGFLLLMSVCGGALALGTLARELFRHCLISSRGPVRQRFGATGIPSTKPTVPYGVAIAAAGAATLIFAR